MLMLLNQLICFCFQGYPVHELSFLFFFLLPVIDTQNSCYFCIFGQVSKKPFANSHTDPLSHLKVLIKKIQLYNLLNPFSQPAKGQYLEIKEQCCPGDSALLPLCGNGSCYCSLGSCSHNAKVSYMLMLMPKCQGFIHDDADYNAGAGADAAMPTFHKSHFNDHCH